MPVKFIPYSKNPVEGQAILNNIARSRRVLNYRDNGKVFQKIERGMPLYDVELLEEVKDEKPENNNLLIRGECLSACAYLKENNIKVDLVYIDPPFASGADYAKKIYIRKNPKLAEKLQAKQQQLAEQQIEFEDLKNFEETMYGDIWQKEDYLNWMYENLSAIKEVMSDTASIYVHLDWHIGHYVKILMDEVFGEENFKREIIWYLDNVSGFKGIAPNWIRDHDTIFFYSRNDKVVFNKTYDYESYPQRYEEKFSNTEQESGRKYMNRNGRRQYLDELKGKAIGDVWKIAFENNMSLNRVNYSTQKPEALLQRIIKASSNEGMIIADFFGGSGVAAKVAGDLNRQFIHCDIGLNSIQTTRDRLKQAGNGFKILEIKDGVNLFRNPTQTMDKICQLIDGLNKNDGTFSNFWFGFVEDSKFGTVPVYIPTLKDSSQKVLDLPTINQIINYEMHHFAVDVEKIIIYYIDIDDEKAIKKFIKEENQSLIQFELRDLKDVLQNVVFDDDFEFEVKKQENGFEVEISSYKSDILQEKIAKFNEKGNQNSLLNGKMFSPILISDEALELIELISLDCSNENGIWQSDFELKIDKLGFVINNGKKTKEFWNGKIIASKKPKRIKIRNICGDEVIKNID
jgi:adenine-specific DNA-methyltransferase